MLLLLPASALLMVGVLLVSRAEDRALLPSRESQRSVLAMAATLLSCQLTQSLEEEAS